MKFSQSLLFTSLFAVASCRLFSISELKRLVSDEPKGHLKIVARHVGFRVNAASLESGSASEGKDKPSAQQNTQTTQTTQNHLNPQSSLDANNKTAPFKQAELYQDTSPAHKPLEKSPLDAKTTETKLGEPSVLDAKTQENTLNSPSVLDSKTKTKPFERSPLNATTSPYSVDQIQALDKKSRLELGFFADVPARTDGVPVGGKLIVTLYAQGESGPSYASQNIVFNNWGKIQPYPYKTTSKFSEARLMYELGLVIDNAYRTIVLKPHLNKKSVEKISADLFIEFQNKHGESLEPFTASTVTYLQRPLAAEFQLDIDDPDEQRSAQTPNEFFYFPIDPRIPRTMLPPGHPFRKAPRNW